MRKSHILHLFWKLVQISFVEISLETWTMILSLLILLRNCQLYSVVTVVAMGVYEACNHVGGFALFALPAIVPCFVPLALLYTEFTEERDTPSATRYLCCSILFVWIIQTVCSIANMRMAAILSSLVITCLSHAVCCLEGRQQEASKSSQEAVSKSRLTEQLTELKKLTCISIGIAVAMGVFTACSHLYTMYWE